MLKTLKKTLRRGTHVISGIISPALWWYLENTGQYVKLFVSFFPKSSGLNCIILNDYNAFFKINYKHLFLYLNDNISLLLIILCLFKEMNVETNNFYGWAYFLLSKYVWYKDKGACIFKFQINLGRKKKEKNKNSFH